MGKKKEQLQEEEVKETPEVVETTPEAVEEKPAEEPVAEEPVKEEESAKEEPAPEKEPEEKKEEEIEKVDELQVETEQLAKEILETKEELSVIKEVRDELVKLYGDYQEVEKLKNTYAEENTKLKEQLSVTSAKLQEYKIAEEKLAEEKYAQRLEQLSAKFEALGQTKTVEELRQKDSETLSEFETIVDTALLRVGDTGEMPSVTRNSQTETFSNTSNQEKLSDKVVPSETKTEAKTEKLNNGDFFAGICSKLTNEQSTYGKGKKVVDL